MCEDICFIDSNDKTKQFVTIGLKGVVQVYKVNSSDDRDMKSCVIEWQASVSDVLVQRSHLLEL